MAKKRQNKNFHRQRNHKVVVQVIPKPSAAPESLKADEKKAPAIKRKPISEEQRANIIKAEKRDALLKSLDKSSADYVKYLQNIDSKAQDKFDEIALRFTSVMMLKKHRILLKLNELPLEKYYKELAELLTVQVKHRVILNFQNCLDSLINMEIDELLTANNVFKVQEYRKESLASLAHEIFFPSKTKTSSGDIPLIIIANTKSHADFIHGQFLQNLSPQQVDVLDDASHSDVRFIVELNNVNFMAEVKRLNALAYEKMQYWERYVRVAENSKEYAFRKAKEITYFLLDNRAGSFVQSRLLQTANILNSAEKVAEEKNIVNIFFLMVLGELAGLWNGSFVWNSIIAGVSTLLSHTLSGYSVDDVTATAAKKSTFSLSSSASYSLATGLATAGLSYVKQDMYYFFDTLGSAVGMRASLQLMKAVTEKTNRIFKVIGRRYTSLTEGQLSDIHDCLLPVGAIFFGQAAGSFAVSKVSNAVGAATSLAGSVSDKICGLFYTMPKAATPAMKQKSFLSLVPSNALCFKK